MKRSALKRRPKPRVSRVEAEARWVFKTAYENQRCAWCGRYAEVSHHVVLEQHLQPNDKWRTAGALPLCRDCHGIHHDGSDRLIPVGRLTEANHRFGREVLGEAWEGYLSRRYSGSITERNGGAACDRPPPGQRGLEPR